MAVGLVLDVEVLAVLMDAVRGTLFPLGDARRLVATVLVVFAHLESGV
jgi:hypothetical protein